MTKWILISISCKRNKMRKIIVFGFLIVVTLCGIKAQQVNITLPQDANKEYVFILNKGINQDTIQSGRLNFAGNAIVNIPPKDKGYIGSGALIVKDTPALNMIVDQESFSVHQDADNKYIFKNSRENEYLYSFIQDKEKPAEDTSLYADYLIKLIRYMRDLNQVTTGHGGLMEKTSVRLYALDKLDVDRLYTSGLWYNIIDGITRLTADQEILGQDMVQILKRIKSDEVFEHLAENLVTITEQYGWDDAFDIIVPYVQESGRIETPRDRMYAAFTMAKVRKGMSAPPVAGLAKLADGEGFDKTLLVFYQPDCHNCEEQLELLIKDYSRFKEQNIRIVSISSDHNKETFVLDCEKFPWSDKLCDFRGFAGVNYLNYGVLGTPTFFLLDKNYVVLGRYARVNDILF